MRTNNRLKRLDKEINRSICVATLLPNDASTFRLLAAGLGVISDDRETPTGFPEYDSQMTRQFIPAFTEDGLLYLGRDSFQLFLGTANDFDGIPQDPRLARASLITVSSGIVACFSDTAASYARRSSSSSSSSTMRRHSSLGTTTSVGVC
ncbi:MAG: hypothetical protein DWI04_04910 [Planctomycetota bacterium]|nr:MAG: hypothetical protein DWI04_04910 [Planctomycetota bacterium]